MERRIRQMGEAGAINFVLQLSEFHFIASSKAAPENSKPPQLRLSTILVAQDLRLVYKGDAMSIDLNDPQLENKLARPGTGVQPPQGNRR